MPSAEGGIFLPFKGEKKHIKHYILWYELFTLHRYRGYPDFKVLILFMKESTEGVAFPFDDRFQLLTDSVYQRKYNEKVRRLIKNAKFRLPKADIHDNPVHR